MNAKTNMNWPVTLAAALLFTFVAQPACAKWNEKKQATLDAACEAARQQKLAPMKAEFVEECVEKKQKPDRAACERFYADFGNQSGNRAPLFYDLPECEEAFQYRKSR